MKKPKFFLTIGLMFGMAYGLIAQEAIISTGGDATGSGGSASFTIGQVFYKTHTGASGSVAEGVQQPYEISEITGVERVDIGLGIAAYPNPVTDYLILKVEDSELKGLSYQLYDIRGKLLQRKEIRSSEMQVRMDGLVPSVYILKVLEGKKVVKSFKVVKK